MLYAEIDIERRLLLSRVAQLESQVAKLTPKPKKAKNVQPIKEAA